MLRRDRSISRVGGVRRVALALAGSLVLAGLAAPQAPAQGLVVEREPNDSALRAQGPLVPGSVVVGAVAPAYADDDLIVYATAPTSLQLTVGNSVRRDGVADRPPCVRDDVADCELLVRLKTNAGLDAGAPQVVPVGGTSTLTFALPSAGRWIVELGKRPSVATIPYTLEVLPGASLSATPVASPLLAAQLSLDVDRVRRRPRPSVAVSGQVTLLDGQVPTEACAGRVRVELLRRGRRLASRTASVDGTCSFSTAVGLRRGRTRSVRLRATYLGDAALARTRASEEVVRLR